MAETVLATPRLTLRSWDQSDVDPFMAALNTPDVMRWLGGVGERPLYERLLQRMTLCQREHGHCFWIVERRGDARLLGFCGLYRSERPGTPVDGMTEIGWRLRSDAQGHGYAREAAEASLGHGFSRLAVDRIVAFTVRQNAAHWGLMQRLGMVRAPELDHRVEGHGDELADHLVYAIDRGEWAI